MMTTTTPSASDTGKKSNCPALIARALGGTSSLKKDDEAGKEGMVLVTGSSCGGGVAVESANLVVFIRLE